MHRRGEPGPHQQSEIFRLPEMSSGDKCRSRCRDCWVLYSAQDVILAVTIVKIGRRSDMHC